VAYTITKIADGDLSLGNLAGEFVALQPSVSDYPSSGYPIIDTSQVVANSALKANCDLDKIAFVAPVGGQGGYGPIWNPTTKKLQMFVNGPSGQPNIEVTAGTDLSKQTFNLLIAGY